MIDVTDISRQFSSAAAQRGKNYYYQGRVAEITTQQDGSIVGKVRGSEVYTQKIILNGKKITGFCSCPLGGDCKHVVAALYHYVNNASKKADEDARLDAELEKWLAQFDEPKAEKKATVNKAIFYLLSVSDKNYLTVETCSAAMLKSGGYGQVRGYVPESAVRGGALPKFVTDEDQSIMRSLYYHDYSGYRYVADPTELNDAGDASLLDRILATGRSRWGSEPDGPALSLGPETKGEFAWRVETGGTQRLEIRTPDLPRATSCFVGNALYYYDPSAHRIGVIHTPFTGSTLKNLLSAPPVASDAVAKVRERLGKAFAQGSGDAASSALPMPEKFEQQLVAKQVKPTPQLRLTSFTLESKLWGRPNVTTAGGDLTFSYEGAITHFAAQGDTATKAEGGRLYDIMRNKKEEYRLIDILKKNHLGRLLPEQKMYSLPKTQGDPFIIVGAPGEINTEESFEAWCDFMTDVVPALRDKGWKIDVEPDFPFNIVKPDEEWYADIDDSSGTDWFGFNLGVTLGGEKINLVPILLRALKIFPEMSNYSEEHIKKARGEDLLIPMEDGKIISLPADRVGLMLKFIKDLYSFREGADFDAIKLSRNDALDMLELEELSAALKLRRFGGNKLIELAKKLKSFNAVQPTPPPTSLRANLRDYQREGLSWLQFLREFGLAGVLADDMGLGKTVQVLAHIACEKENGRLTKPALVVAPTSLMGNWAKEAARFVPDIKVLVQHGASRKEDFDNIPQYDMVLTTYPLLPRDKDALLAHAYHSVILDEAHYIKNPKSKFNKIASMMKADHRICMTGTPVENHLGELWALFNFLMPDYLGSDREFNKFYRKAIEKDGNFDRNKALARRIAPFVLRRTKEQVAAELPPKTEMIRTATLDKAQRDLYETIRVSMSEKVRDEIAKKGLARSHIVVLEALLKLRQTCCDPRLLPMEGAKKLTESAKLDMLMEMLPGLIEDGRKILLFSQFTGMLKLIEGELAKEKIDYVKLTGQTKDRATPIERFQNGDVPLFLISLKAGGVGLNLTAADTVIHYDPWWNPAAENQATDRAHRIGQEKPVFVYKLITEGTVEEKILEMQEKKRELADGIFDPTANAGAKITGDEVAALFSAA